jgi:hypothetical protein
MVGCTSPRYTVSIYGNVTMKSPVQLIMLITMFFLKELSQKSLKFASKFDNNQIFFMQFVKFTAIFKVSGKLRLRNPSPRFTQLCYQLAMRQ